MADRSLSIALSEPAGPQRDEFSPCFQQNVEFLVRFPRDYAYDGYYTYYWRLG